MRNACIRLDDTEPFDVDLKKARSHKIAQITGEIDIAGEGIGSIVEVTR